eukprot:1399610-Prymnesium_polylepis.1
MSAPVTVCLPQASAKRAAVWTTSSLNTESSDAAVPRNPSAARSKAVLSPAPAPAAMREGMPDMLIAVKAAMDALARRAEERLGLGVTKLRRTLEFKKRQAPKL